MAGTKTESKNCITLKGSAQLVSEFFYYGINSILYQRGVYPPESFTYKQQYGLTLFTTTDDKVKEYLENVLAQIKDWLEAGHVQRLVLVVTNVDNKEVLERWSFNIQHEAGFGPQSAKDPQKNEESRFQQFVYQHGFSAASFMKGTKVWHASLGKVGNKDLKIIQKEMRDVIRQITACVTFLPLLDCVCAFDLLVYTNQNADVPEKWGESAPCFISNSQEVRLKSFSTSVHKVDACVSYKIDD